MRWLPCLPLALGAVVAVAPATAHHRTTWHVPGSLLDVSVDVDGRGTPLYPAPDGSGRYYLEARTGSRYEVRLENRSGERLGVVVTVDGLNAISGRIDAPGRGARRPGRMYVLDPWEVTVVRGWRTSLDSVQLFTFVDEGASYAARTGQSNRKLGWIEIAVHRERYPRPYVQDHIDDRLESPTQGRSRNDVPPPASDSAAGERPAEAQEAPAVAGRDRAESSRRKGAHAPSPSYPGTGWGPRANDPARLVQFDPDPQPAHTVSLRYEYRAGLQTLGVVPARPHRDRLWERDRAAGGFARPPAPE